MPVRDLFFRGKLLNLVQLGGLGAVLHGLWMVWPPLTFIAGGAILILVAEIIDIKKKPPEE